MPAAAAAPIAAAEAEVAFSVEGAVATIRLNRPRKYNAWREVDTQLIRARLRECAADASIGAVILTGTGAYYSAGADITSSIRLTRPSTFRAHIRAYNESIFDMFINFPKPIFTAVNGPAVGVGVTSATLTDAVVASTTATFHTPFAQLGLPPEGCSSFNFPRRFGAEAARLLLDEGRKVTAQEALRFGLADEVVEPEQLLPRARELAEAWVRARRPRPIVAQGLVAKLKEVNAAESAAFGEAVTSPAFFAAQLRLAQEKKKDREAWVFWFLAKAVPLVSRL